MRGQFFNIEYVVGLVIFLTIIMYLGFQIGWLLPEYHFTSTSAQLKSKAFRATEYLIKSPGQPQGWTSLTMVQKIGLASQPYVLDSAKIDELMSECKKNYELVREKLWLTGHEFRLRIGNDYCCSQVECEAMHIPVQAIKVSAGRWVSLQGIPTILVLELW